MRNHQLAFLEVPCHFLLSVHFMHSCTHIMHPKLQRRFHQQIEPDTRNKVKHHLQVLIFGSHFILCFPFPSCKPKKKEKERKRGCILPVLQMSVVSSISIYTLLLFRIALLFGLSLFWLRDLLQLTSSPFVRLHAFPLSIFSASFSFSPPFYY